MTAQELRIGNWVSTPEGIAKIVAIDYVKVTLHGFTKNGSFKIFEESLEDVCGIELTINIILKCGFNKDRNIIPIYSLGLLSIYWISNDYPEGRVYYNSWCIHKYKPKSLHQLQNLFYSLTQTELEIKL